MDRYEAYKLTCLPTGKVYIGVTSKTVPFRVSKHFYNATRGVGGRLYVAMREYEIEDWSVDVVGTALTWSDLLAMERKLILLYRSSDLGVGYNSTIGGQGTCGLRFKKTAEQAEKSARSHRGRKRSSETVARMSASRAAWWVGYRVGEKATKTTRNPQRDVDIVADYFSSPSLAKTGERFGVTGPAVSAAVRRVSARIDVSIEAATGVAHSTDLAPPVKIHPDWLGLAL